MPLVNWWQVRYNENKTNNKKEIKMSNESIAERFNSLFVCMIGKCRIETDENGRVIAVINRGKFRLGDEARAFVESHPRLKTGVEKWFAWRSEEINRWKHVTPHYRYHCDGGSLAVRVNGVMVKVGNGVGDGDFPVYVVRDDRIPPSFKSTGLSIDGPCKVEPLDYDCGGGIVLEAISLTSNESAWFRCDNAGAVVIEVEVMSRA